MFWLAMVLLSVNSTFAYIPEYSMIASRTADQHGRGAYWIEQEVTFRRDNESMTVHESWLVVHENRMRVTIEGRGPLKGQVQGTMLFEGGQKFFIEPGGTTVRPQRLGDEWLEPLFHFRFSKNFRQRLVALKVAPPDSLQDRRPLSSREPTVSYLPQNFLRLSRVGGALAWAIGRAPTSGPVPTLWIEQDQFVVRKYQSANQVIVKADDYSKYDEGLWFPRLRTFQFGSYSIEVNTLQVKSLGKLRPEDPRFHIGKLSPTRDALKVPEIEPLKEFYARFR